MAYETDDAHTFFKSQLQYSYQRSVRARHYAKQARDFADRVGFRTWADEYWVLLRQAEGWLDDIVKLYCHDGEV
ncbi:MAG: hypothetical protein GY700_06525 [Propionibacteriaceae bacterium]|nr:hypothetical protein [Propionibacteriaceae bacterium]